MNPVHDLLHAAAMSFRIDSLRVARFHRPTSVSIYVYIFGTDPT
jgi:hypothetical protein